MGVQAILFGLFFPEKCMKMKEMGPRGARIPGATPWICHCRSITSMHSSRMRTVCSSDSQGGVYPSMHWAGGCVSQHTLGRGCVSQHALGKGCAQGVCLPRGCVCPGECLPRGVFAQGRCLPRGVSVRVLGVKYYLSATSFADGNKNVMY